MSDKAREAAARAICENDSDETWDEEIDSSRAHYRRLARAAIDAYLVALGETHAVVPRVLTEPMEQGMLDALELREHYCDAATVAEVYRAALSAAPRSRA